MTTSAPGTFSRPRRVQRAAKTLPTPGPAPGLSFPRERGFTLLELLVVLAIVGVLAGLVVPSLGGSEQRQLRSEAEKLVLLVNRARQEAVLGSRTWRLVLRPAEGAYRFQRQGPGGDFTAVEGGLFAKAHEMQGVAWDDLTVNGQPAVDGGEVHLFPTGEQDGFRLTLSAGDHSRVIQMDVVGRARLQGREEAR